MNTIDKHHNYFVAMITAFLPLLLCAHTAGSECTSRAMARLLLATLPSFGCAATLILALASPLAAIAQRPASDRLYPSNYPVRPPPPPLLAGLVAFSRAPSPAPPLHCDPPSDTPHLLKRIFPHTGRRAGLVLLSKRPDT